MGEISPLPLDAGERSDPAVREFLVGVTRQHPELHACMPAMENATRMLVNCFRTGGTLFICGNGGSFADAFHIAAELNKSFKNPRPIPSTLRERLQQQPDGDELAGSLQQGLRSIALGANPSLLSAVDNDNSQRHLYFAQELVALAKPGDVLLGISTSGGAKNVRLAMIAAKAMGLRSIALTGSAENPLQEIADVAILSPGNDTAGIQEWHIRIYHALCEQLEQIFFGERRER